MVLRIPGISLVVVWYWFKDAALAAVVPFKARGASETMGVARRAKRSPNSEFQL